MAQGCKDDRAARTVNADPLGRCMAGQHIRVVTAAMARGSLRFSRSATSSAQKLLDHSLGNNAQVQQDGKILDIGKIMVNASPG